MRDIEQIIEDNLDTLNHEWDRFAITPKAVSVGITDDTLTVDLEDGRTLSVPIGWYPRLSHANAKERMNFQLSGAGYGIHWPDLDEDIGIEGLFLGKKSSESPTSFARWLDQRAASRT